LAFANISHEETGDAAALFTMFRNVAGSVGISLSTALIADRTQVRMAHLAPHMTPLDQGFATTLQIYRQALLAQGHDAASAGTIALGRMFQTFRMQAAVLAFSDVFAVCAVMAFAVVPLAFLLSAKKGGGPGAA
jgi:DHA2 family multidrug resistance protein